MLQLTLTIGLLFNVAYVTIRSKLCNAHICRLLPILLVWSNYFDETQSTSFSVTYKFILLRLASEVGLLKLAFYLQYIIERIILVTMVSIYCIYSGCSNWEG